MTTYELTWNESRNNAYVNATTSVSDLGYYLTWFMKAALMAQIVYRDYTNTIVGSPAGAWSCQGSSDSVTGAMDAVDRWGSTYNSAKLVGSSGQGTAHSWIVLKSPWGLYMLIDMCNYFSAGRPAFINIQYSLTAFTGGSSTTAPTSSNTFMPQAAAGHVQTSPDLASPNCHFNSWLSTTGEAMLLVSQDGQGAPFLHMQQRTLVETHTGDNNNAHTYFEFVSNAGPSNGGAFNQFFAAPGGGNNVGWQTRSATPATAAVGCSGTFEKTGTVSLYQDMPEFDPIDGLANDMAIYLYAYTLSHKSIRGRLRDISMCSSSIADNRVEPSPGPLNSIKLGGPNNPVLFPWHDPKVGMYL